MTRRIFSRTGFSRIFKAQHHFEEIEPLYTPLSDTPPQVRLIKVIATKNGQQDDAIVECIMNKVDLSDVQDQYVALSYAWGDLNDRKPILINGHRHLVTVNLEAFLRQWQKHASYPDAWTVLKGYLWIDAVCINQEDVLERNSQVKLMSKIYPSAAMTLSWLGQGLKSCGHVIHSLCVMGNDVEGTLEGQNIGDRVHGDETLAVFRRQQADSTGYFRNDVWDGIHDLFSLRYWNRAWIQQELVLGTRVCFWYGSAWAYLTHLMAVEHWVRRARDQPCPQYFSPELWKKLTRSPMFDMIGIVPPIRRIGILRDTRLRAENRALTALETFDIFNRVILDLESTDPRDMIYSVLGVLSLTIDTDYDRPVEDVYLQFAANWITSKEGLVILFLAGDRSLGVNQSLKPHHLYLPSWAPCWDLPSGRNLDFYMTYPFQGPVLETWSPLGKVLVEGNRLKVRGMAVTNIEWPQARDANSDQGDDRRYSFFEFVKSYINTASTAAPNEVSRRLRLLFRMICGDRDPITGERLNSSLEHREQVWNACRIAVLGICAATYILVQDFLRCIEIETSIDFASKILQDSNMRDIYRLDPVWRAQYDADCDRFHSNLRIRLINNTPFITMDGCVGWAPKAVQNNDVVCILFGQREPVLLREVNNVFKYIGPCMVPGIMDGELMTPEILGSDRVQTFTII